MIVVKVECGGEVEIGGDGFGDFFKLVFCDLFFKLVFCDLLL